MAYVYIILLTILFSFGGILIKTSGIMFSPVMMSFLRFAIGVVLLLVIEVAKYRRIRISFVNRLILIGGAAKAVNYLLENYGVMRGFSYGNVIIWPVQAIVALLAGIFLFHEKTRVRSIVGAVMCVTGIVIVSLNGVDFTNIAGGQAALLPVFAGAGIAAATFTISQKLLIGKMETTESNLSMFVIGCAICLFPAAGTGSLKPAAISFPAVGAILILGSVTGIGFLLQAEALKEIPLFMVTMIQSSSVILSLFWAVVIYHEPVTRYIVFGTLLFLAGMLMINLKVSKQRN